MSERPSKLRLSKASVHPLPVASVPAERNGARIVVLTEQDAASLGAVIAALPDPSTLAPGALVIVPAKLAGGSSLARSVLSMLGRPKTVARSRRCSALLARGYVRVGAASDESGDDLAWGYAPTEPC